MFICMSCGVKLSAKSQFTCGHILCPNCIYVDKNSKAICPLDKKHVQRKDNEITECAELKDVNKEIQALKNETSLVLKLFKKKDIIDVLQEEKGIFVVEVKSKLKAIGDSLDCVKKVTDELSSKVVALEKRQEQHAKKCEALCWKETRVVSRCSTKTRRLAVCFRRSRRAFTHVWKLQHFSKFQRKAERNFKDEILYSEPVICDAGYQVCLLVCPFGIGAALGTHLSFYFQIIDGPNDDSLRWPARFRIAFLLIDQSGESDHYCYQLPGWKSVIYSPSRDGDTLCRGQKFFYPLSELEPKYLVDDTVCLQVNVMFY